MSLIKKLFRHLFPGADTPVNEAKNDPPPEPDYTQLSAIAARCKSEFSLTDVVVDTECINSEGDLTRVIKRCVDTLIPGLDVKIRERTSGNNFTATVLRQGKAIGFYADTDSDWLPPEFMESMQKLPVILNTGKRIYQVNSGIYDGQCVWFFCGTQGDLERARLSGLPLVFDGENCFESPEYKIYCRQVAKTS